MTLDQLQIFIAVAEREHVTRAAAALGLAPPSVSAAVASLERELGTKLFHRVGRGIVVTEGGKLLLDEARALVNRAEAVKLAMREFTGLARGRLQIKASQTIAFTNPGPQTLSPTPLPLTATATSTLAITFSSATTFSGLRMRTFFQLDP